MTPTFHTDSGVRVPAVTGEQMAEVDRLATEEIGPNLFQMMENAGHSLALTAIEMLGNGWSRRPIVILAGSGHNGGGGICAARHLANHGGNVTVATPETHRLSPASVNQLKIYDATPGRVVRPEDLPATESELIIDAMIGYGLAGAPRGTIHDMIDWSIGRSTPIVSLDVPSGVNSTTGLTPGIHVTAARTLTLALPKTGLDVLPVGELLLADIGIPRGIYDRIGIDVPPSIFEDGYTVPLRREVADR